MIKAKNGKCVNCGIYYPIEELKIINGKKYCSTCSKVKLKESQEYKDLSDYIYHNLINEDQFLMGFCCKQIKRLKEDYGMKYKSIEYTLRYIYEYLENPPEFDPNYCLANVPFYYLDAKEFFKQLWAQNKTSQEKIDEIISQPDTIIVIKRDELIKQDQSFEEQRGNKIELLDKEGIDLADDENEEELI